MVCDSETKTKNRQTDEKNDFSGFNLTSPFFKLKKDDIEAFQLVSTN